MITDCNNYYSYPKVLVEGETKSYYDKFSDNATFKYMIECLLDKSYCLGVSYHVIRERAKKITILVNELIMIRVL